MAWRSRWTRLVLPPTKSGYCVSPILIFRGLIKQNVCAIIEFVLPRPGLYKAEFTLHSIPNALARVIIY